MNVFRRRPSLGAVIAIIALFVLLGGSAAILQGHGAAAAPLGPQYAKLTLKNGWVGGPFGTRVPAAALDSFGIVHFEGAMNQASGSAPNAFRLGKVLRPGKWVFLTVDLCNGNVGRLEINPSGEVSVRAETNYPDAQCFTSLDGVSYSK